MSEEELIDFDLLRKHGDRWKYRYAVGSSFSFASSKGNAIEMATEAFLKAHPSELLTKSERYVLACREDIDASESRWGHLSMDELTTMMIRMGGDIKKLQASSSREFNGNGGRRSSCAVSAHCSRCSAEMLMKLERYISHRQERTS